MAASAGRQKRLADRDEARKFEQSPLGWLDDAYNLARWLLRDDQDAQDAVQDAFIRATRFALGCARSSSGRSSARPHPYRGTSGTTGCSRAARRTVVHCAPYRAPSAARPSAAARMGSTVAQWRCTSHRTAPKAAPARRRRFLDPPKRMSLGTRSPGSMTINIARCRRSSPASAASSTDPIAHSDQL